MLCLATAVRLGCCLLQYASRMATARALILAAREMRALSRPLGV
jgi:hypothetical protein